MHRGTLLERLLWFVRPGGNVAARMAAKGGIHGQVRSRMFAEGVSERRCTIAEILRFARVCRVERVMRPYLEALVA